MSSQETAVGSSPGEAPVWMRKPWVRAAARQRRGRCGNGYRVKVAVIGTGYVGLVAGACFADSGTSVVCVDKDEAKLEKLKRGDVPFFEPRLAELVLRNWPDRLEFSSNLAQSINGREVVFVAVGTPPNEDGSADLSHVLTVAEQVAKA